MSSLRDRVADLEVMRYKLAEDEDGLVVLETRGPGAWVICVPGSPSYVRSKSGEWRYESSPSNRTQEFIKATRYATSELAFEDWLKYKARIVAETRPPEEP